MGIVMQATVTRVAILLRHKDINHRPGAQAPYLAYLCALALWEYGSLPVTWVRAMGGAVDEIWANSHYLQDMYVRCGVPADRVHLVPLTERLTNLTADMATATAHADDRVTIGNRSYSRDDTPAAWPTTSTTS